MWLIPLFALVLFLDFAKTAYERRLRRALLIQREPLSDEQIYKLFYEHIARDKAAVLTAWRDAAAVLHVDPGLLRPDDRLDTLVALPQWLQNRMSPSWTDVDELEPLLDERRRRSRQPQRFETVDDVVRHLAGVGMEGGAV